MQRPLKNLLTASELNALVAFCAFGLMGLSLTFLQGGKLAAPEGIATADSLEVATLVDKPVQVDIRTAVADDLELLPGIGAKRAADIIAFREANPLTGVGDLLQVKGIGPKTLAKMLPFIVPFGEPWGPPDSLPAPSKTSPKSASAPAKATPKSELTNIVNLNTAGIEELTTLPGIGEVKARAIIDHRTANGPFRSVDEIVQVKGIGAKTLEKLRARLSI